jgi:AcrR family transcriptional regulator
MVMAGRSAPPRRRLTADDWAAAALSAIAESGLSAVAVEPLAVRLGTTKGSFYWHFASRAALLEAALSRWERQTTTDVAARVRASAADPLARLRLLIIEVVEMAESDRIGVALLASAAHPAVAPVLARVTEQRLAIIAGLFAELGFPPAAARRRALLAYSSYLGHAQLSHTTPELLPRDSGARRAYLDDVLSVLTALPAAGSGHEV